MDLLPNFPHRPLILEYLLIWVCSSLGALPLVVQCPGVLNGLYYLELVGTETQAYQYLEKRLCVLLKWWHLRQYLLRCFWHLMTLLQSWQCMMLWIVVYLVIGQSVHLYLNHILVHLSELHLIGGGNKDNASGLAYQAVPAWHKLN